MLRRVAPPLLVAGAFLACSSFETIRGTDAGTSELDAAAVVDGASEEAGLLSTTCQVSRAPRCELARCDHLPFTPAAPEFPFAMTTDTTSLYWVAQAPGTDPESARNGTGNASVYRLPKTMQGPATILATGQQATTTIAIDGEWVYWATGASSESLARVRRDCQTACVAQPFLVSLATARLQSLRAVTPGKLVAITNDGDVILIETEHPDGSAPSARTILRTSGYPGLAVTASTVFASGARAPDVQAITVATGAFSSIATIPDAVAADPGLWPLATDCTDVFGLRARSSGHDLYRVDVAGRGAALLSELSHPISTYVNGIAADERYVYLGDTGAGLFVADKVLGAQLVTVDPTTAVWGLVVDDDGIFYGNHGTGSTSGTITAIYK